MNRIATLNDFMEFGSQHVILGTVPSCTTQMLEFATWFANRELTEDERKQLAKESMERYVDILQAYLANPSLVEELAVNAKRIDL